MIQCMVMEVVVLKRTLQMILRCIPIKALVQSQFQKKNDIALFPNMEPLNHS